MPQEQIFWIISSVIAIGIEFRYLFSIFKGKTKPSFFGWTTIVVSMSLVFLSSWQLGADFTLYLIGTLIILHTIAAISAFKYGITKLGKTDGIFLFIAICSLILWGFTKNPLLVLLINVVIDALWMMIIIHKLYKNPGSEDTMAWGGSVIFYLLALFAIKHWQIWEYLFPLSNLTTCLIVFLLTLRKSEALYLCNDSPKIQ